jgi:hypothetical protein
LRLMAGSMIVSINPPLRYPNQNPPFSPEYPAFD